MEPELLVVLVGPTAVGKTAVALELAERIGGEIVNADSMQVYRGMDIGTAKPSPAEQARVPFHLLDVVTPDASYSVGQWREQAETAIAEIRSRGKRPLVCGGTGLYIKTLLDGWSLAATPSAPELRANLNQREKDEGSPVLHAELQAVDPKTAERLHPNDGVRIVRALEVYYASGTPISQFQDRDRAAQRTVPALRFGLTMPRPELYARIAARVDAMFAAGLLAEVQGLLDSGFSPELHPLKSLGYKESISFLRGEITHEDAVAQIKQNTRRYAKRQQTWFRPDTKIIWYDVSGFSSAEVAANLHRQIASNI